MSSVLYLSTNGDEVTTLAEAISSNGQCAAVVEISGKINRKQDSLLRPLYLCCDFVENANLHTRKLPILKQFTTNRQGYVNSSVGHVIWMKVTRSRLSQVRLYICDDDGETVSFTGRGIYCTLVLH